MTAGQAIAISAGTTTYAVARRLLDVPRLTVVTNSVPVADVLYHGGRSDQTVILTGGVRTPSDALVGPFAVAALRTVNVDLVLMGVHGMDPRAGFTTPNMLEAETDRALVDAGRRLVVVADHTKWGVIGVSTIARFSPGGPAHLRSRAVRCRARRAPQEVQELHIAGEPHRSTTSSRGAGDGGTTGEPR